MTCPENRYRKGDCAADRLPPGLMGIETQDAFDADLSSLHRAEQAQNGISRALSGVRAGGGLRQIEKLRAAVLVRVFPLLSNSQDAGVVRAEKWQKRNAGPNHNPI